MNRYKIGVYAICKNEEAFVDRWMDSMAEADLIVVTDTGSTDGTVEKLRQRGAIVFVDIVKPWRVRCGAKYLSGPYAGRCGDLRLHGSRRNFGGGLEGEARKCLAKRCHHGADTSTTGALRRTVRPTYR